MGLTLGGVCGGVTLSMQQDGEKELASVQHGAAEGVNQSVFSAAKTTECFSFLQSVKFS